MKVLAITAIFFLTPLILCVILLSAILPLFVQHFFWRKRSDNAVVYPYLTSWEEAA